jgi:hypothetical protein
MQRKMMVLISLILLVTPCFADELSTLLYRQQQLQSELREIDGRLATFAIENPVTTGALICLVGGPFIIMQDHLPQQNRDAAKLCTGLSALYCMVNFEACKEAAASLTPLLLKKGGIESNLGELKVRIDQLRASPSPRSGKTSG